MSEERWMQILALRDHFSQDRHDYEPHVVSAVNDLIGEVAAQCSDAPIYSAVVR